MRGWIGVDLDGTLAEYDGWKGAQHIGAPIERMVDRVKQWLAEGKEVRIFTARVWPIYRVILPEVPPNGQVIAETDRIMEALQAAVAIQFWCKQHLGRQLAITCVKDMMMVELWDDRAVRVVPNEGIPCCTTEMYA